jgi:hypothetical protein
MVESLTVWMGVHCSGQRVALHRHLEIVNAVEAEEQQEGDDDHEDPGAHGPGTTECLLQVESRSSDRSAHPFLLVGFTSHSTVWVRFGSKSEGIGPES